MSGPAVEPVTTPSRSGRRLARGWHLATAVSLAAGLILQFVLLLAQGEDVNSGESAALAPLGIRVVRFFSYFTIDSNIVLLISVLPLVLDPWRDGRVWRAVRLSGVLAITITGLVYNIVLAPLYTFEGGALVATILLHVTSPLLGVIGWLAFGPRPRVDRSTVAWSFVWPVGWLLYTFVHGAVTDWYPYPFLDVTVLGLPTALSNAAAVLVVALLLALLVRLADRRLPSTDHRRA